MARRTKEEFKRKRKPSIFIVCEGRNKTERTFFNHFNKRNAPYNLRVKDSEATDIMSMAKKAAALFTEYELDAEIGDKVYCLVDLDLEQNKYDKYLKAKKLYKNIEIIPSNPCFETWLQYYFTAHPKAVSSSQKAKEEMQGFVAGYTESIDVISIKNFSINNHIQAIDRAEKKNGSYPEGQTIVEKNPYTEVQMVVCDLLERYK